MATIASLNIGIRADASGLRQGFQAGLQQLAAFVQSVDKVRDGVSTLTPAVAASTGGLRMLGTTGATSMTAVNGQTLQLKTTLTAAGAAVVDATRKLRGLGDEGARAGARAAAGVGQVSAGTTAATGRFQALGGVALSILPSIAFRMDDIAAGGQKAQSAVKGLLGDLSSVVATFIPGGVLVKSIAAAAAIMINFFLRARDEAAKTTEAFRQELGNLVNARDVLSIQRRMADIWRGTFDPKTEKLTPGLGPLKAQLDVATALRKEIDKMGARGASRFPEFVQAGRDIARLTPQVEKLQGRFDELDRAREIMASLPRELMLAPDVRVEGKSDAALAAERLRQQREELQRLKEDTDNLIQAIDFRRTFGGDVQGAMRAVLNRFDQLRDRLARTKDQAGETAQALQDMLTTLSKVPIVQVAGLDQRIGLPHDVRNPMLPPAQRIDIPRAEQARFGQIAADIQRLAETRVQIELQRRAEVISDALDDVAQRIRDGADAILARTAVTKNAFEPSTFIPQIVQMLQGAVLDVTQQFTPLGLAASVLSGMFESLQPMLDALREPLRLIGTLIADGFAPALRAIFPILRALAVVGTFVLQAWYSIIGGFYKGLGAFLVAIGKAINKLVPFGNPADALVNLGKSYQKAGEGFLDSADEAKRMRDELKKLDFDDLADSHKKVADAANTAAHALLNLPSGYKALLDLRRFTAMDPIRPPNAPTPPAVAPSPGLPPVPPPPTPGGGGGIEKPPLTSISVTFEGDIVLPASAGTDPESLYQGFRATVIEKARRGGTGAMEIARALPA